MDAEQHTFRAVSVPGLNSVDTSMEVIEKHGESLDNVPLDLAVKQPLSPLSTEPSQIYDGPSPVQKADEPPPPQIAYYETRLKEMETILQNSQARVVALEEGLKVAKEKAEKEKAFMSETIAKKSNTIDIMRVKLNRYEFAIKEAILFLGKPMEVYDTWLRNGPSSVASAPIPEESADDTPTGSPAKSTTNLSSKSKSGKPTNAAPAAAPSRPESATPDSLKSRSTSGPASQNPAQLAQTQQHKMQMLTGANQENTATDPLSLRTSTANQISMSTSPTTQEIQSMECMRLALNYLRNAQASVQNVGKNGTPLERDSTPVHISISDGSNPEKTEGKVAGDDAAGPQKKEGSQKNEGTQAGGSGATPSTVKSKSFAAESSTSLAATSKSIPPRRFSANDVVNRALLNAARAMPDEDEGDLASATSNDPASSKVTSGMCTQCRELMLQLDHYQDTVNYLKRDVTVLANQLEEERATRDRIQLSKDILDQELEELTAQLFDQANRMVIDEARMRDQLETSNRELQGELKDLLKKCETREDELRDLKRSLFAIEAAKARFNYHVSPHGSQMNLTQAGANGAVSPSKVILWHPSYYQTSAVTNFSCRFAPNGTISSVIPVDGLIFSEFQDHIKQTMVSSSMAPAQAVSSMLATAFMKRCYVEDVEPCLFYTYQHTQPSGTLFKTGGMNTSLRKRLLDGIIRGVCEIHVYWTSKENLFDQSPVESSKDKASSDSAAQKDNNNKPETKEGTTPATSPTTPDNVGPPLPSSAPPKTKCTVCGILRECEYRLRFASQDTTTTTKPPPQGQQPARGPVTNSEWFACCRFCRDRVACVADFYTYLGHLRQGLVGPGKQGATILGMFRHMLWLRRRMAVAKVGSCGLFEGDTISGLERRGEIPLVVGSGSSGGGDWERLVQIIH
ncbi:rab guanine nucleotide exchange factor S2 [Quaeritorhiza haematococci]|nr:rab guanine nucleotide exchange factor S2 [Quaeritorhiza haematococci]